ncbi:phosphoribosyltransferase-like protein [Pseudomonas monteilii]|uniref:phosphoribosyltransferase-like protein n=1 Tax=Pseudomonas monteilii TaxID=76759 RepID=UPI003D972910
MLTTNKIPYEFLHDMLDIFEHQSWTKELTHELTDLWNLCEKREEQELLKSLIKDFCIFDAKMEKQAQIAIDDKVQELGLKPKSTWIVGAANRSEIDGSSAALQRLKNKIEPCEEWHSRFLPNIPEAVEKVKEGQTVILFDDFIGSGKKMVDKGTWLRKLLATKEVNEFKMIYMSLSAMKFGLDRIVKDTGCEAFAHNILQKAISEKHPPAQAAVLIETMRKIESRLDETYRQKSIKEYSLGFGESEALYCAENDNCPNNVFPVFWWPRLKSGTPFKTILRRAG